MKVINNIFLILIRIYKKAISPFLPKACRFEPTCSSYAEQAFQRFGVIKAFQLTVFRLFKCHPFHEGGFDPCPQPDGHNHKLTGDLT